MKTKNYSIATLFFLIISNGFGQQTIFPGNVVAPTIWLKSMKSGTNFSWSNLGTTIIPVNNIALKGTSFNNNPSIVFIGNSDVINLPLALENAKKQTLFVVYKVNDNAKEQFLWTATDSLGVKTVATNKRLVDFKNYVYRSYSEKIVGQNANIHFYQQNKSSGINNQYQIAIGSKPSNLDLPPTAFNGNLSEILVYNRVLSALETQKVASYLGVKYGISLSQFEVKNYINSNGDVIWDFEKNKGFRNSITAIGRDDNSNLLQTKSSNMFEDGLLSFEMKSQTNQIPDHYFVFWSDNGKNLSVKKQDEGSPNGTSRIWKVNFENNNDIKLNLNINASMLKHKLLDDEKYWLFVDHSGQGTFEKENSEFIELSIDKDDLSLKNINWKSTANVAHFTLKVAPDMFSQVWIEQPTCGEANSGKLNYSIQGGIAPFAVAIFKFHSSEIVQQWSQSTRKSQDIAIESGNYDYVVTDANKKTYKQSVFVSDKNGTYPNLKNYYLLTGNALPLDASLDLPSGNYQYEWFLNGNLVSEEPLISPNLGGSYEIRITNNQGCKTAFKIEIEANTDGGSLVDAVKIYPNPAIGLNFTTALNFIEKTDVTISIHNVLGVLIKETKLSQIDDFLQTENSSAAAGIYFVTVKTNIKTETFKLIVK